MATVPIYVATATLYSRLIRKELKHMRTLYPRTHRTNPTRLLAGLLTAVILPLSAFSISANFSQIAGAVDNAAQYIKTRTTQEQSQSQSATPEFQQAQINNGNLMLYYYKEHEESQPEFEPKGGTLAIEPESESESEPTPEIPQQEAIAVLSRNISQESEDLSIFSAKDGVVVKRTYRPNTGEGYAQLFEGGQVRNETKISNARLRRESFLAPKFKPEKGNEPQVLIIHTHTTESFTLSQDGSYDSEYTFRTTDSQKNIVAVGAKIAEEIAKAGFAVIHDGTIHDSPVYSGAYKRSAETVKAILAEYPSIKVVLDIHRDAIEVDGSPVAATAEINGSDAAQVMIVAPADDGNWGVPDFMQNFRFASRLQSQLESDSPGLTRAMLFQYCNYNLNLSTGALLIEIGSHGNTLEQAVYAGELFGRSVAAVLENLAEN